MWRWRWARCARWGFFRNSGGGVSARRTRKTACSGAANAAWSIPTTPTWTVPAAPNAASSTSRLSFKPGKFFLDKFFTKVKVKIMKRKKQTPALREELEDLNDYLDVTEAY